MKAALVPWDDSIKNNNIFENPKPGYENAHTLLKKAFLEAGDDINTLDMYEDLNEVDVFLFSTLNYESLAKVFEAGLEKRCVYMSGEPVVVKPQNCKEGYEALKDTFNYFMTVDRTAVDNEHIFFRTLPYYDYPEWRNEPFAKKKLMANLSGNKHSEHKNEIYTVREEIITFMEKEHLDEISLYGPGWNKEEHPSYLGMVDSKREVYHYHKFALSLENTKNVPGYITEKIFDCFNFGIVPIYWGAPDVYEYIPKNCFIDYTEYKSPEKLYEYLKAMPENEYEEYLKNIKAFMDEPKNMEPFSSKTFHENIRVLYEKMSSDKEDFEVSAKKKQEIADKAAAIRKEKKRVARIIFIKKTIKKLLGRS